MSKKSRSSSPNHLTGQELPLFEETQDSSSTRQISLVERLELSVPASRISSNAIILGNIDNDPQNDIELAIGNGDGDLYVFKGKKKYAWKRATGLGSISCLAIGDLLGTRQNSLIAVTVEGSCYLFDVIHHNPSDLPSARWTGDSNTENTENAEIPSNLSSFGQSGRKYPSTELKSASNQLSSLHSDEIRLVQPDPQHPQESAASSVSRSSLGRSANRSDSAPPGAPGKHSEASTQTVTTSTTSKPVVHDDWVSNAPSSSVQPNSSMVAAMAGGGGGGGGVGASPHASFYNATGVQYGVFGSADFGDPSRGTKKETTYVLLEPSGGANEGVTFGNANAGPGSLGGGGLGGGNVLEGGVGSVGRMGRAGSKTEKMVAQFRWFVAGNATCAIIADIDEDQQCELVIGSSNRVVYSYGISHEVDAMGAVVTKLKLKNKWNVSGQVGSLSLSHDRWGRPILIVSQHGGNYTTIDHRGTTKYRQAGLAEPVSQLNAKHERNASTQIRHLFRQPFASDGTPQDPILMAMVGIDGSVKLQQEESSKILWERQLEHQFFSLSILDLTGDGNDEIVACAWDGKTYIFDQLGNCVEFHFEERVAAFAAGPFSLSRGNPIPCLIFLTFTDHLYIYYNIPLKSIPVSSLIGSIGASQFELCRNTKIDKGGAWTRSEQARILRSLLDPTKFDETAAIAYKEALEQRIAALSENPTKLD